MLTTAALVVTAACGGTTPGGGGGGTGGGGPLPTDEPCCGSTVKVPTTFACAADNQAVVEFEVIPGTTRKICGDIATASAPFVAKDTDIYRYRGIYFGGDTSGKNRFGDTPAPTADYFDGVGTYSADDPATFFFAGQRCPVADPKNCATDVQNDLAKTPAQRAFYPHCAQYIAPPGTSIIGSEECLALSVYTPVEPTDTTTKKPVMVWIHGGAFIGGSGHAPLFDGTRLAALGDIVVVALNYRLDVAGFLGGLTGTMAASGNAGLMDQAAAMKWVQRNISKFGGDPTQVTIAGESAGASSVGAHLLRAQLDLEPTELFDQVIMESNHYGMLYKTQAVSTAHTTAAVKNAHKATAEPESCKVDDPTNAQMLECLQELTVDDLFVVASGGLTGLLGALECNSYGGFEYWSPSIDGTYLPLGTGNSSDAAQQDANAQPVNRTATSMPMLMGTNMDEGDFFVDTMASLLALKGYNGMINLLYRTANFGLTGDSGLVKAKYPKPASNGTTENKHELARLLTDYVFTCGANLVARDATSNNKYLYYFTHPPSMDVLGNTGMCEVKTPFVVANNWDESTRACHGGELRYVWGNPIWPSTGIPAGLCPTTAGDTGFCKEEDDVVLQMMNYWTNFVKAGDPNGEGLVTWPAFGADNDQYLELRAVGDPTIDPPAATVGCRAITEPNGPGYRNSDPDQGAWCEDFWTKTAYDAPKSQDNVGWNPVGFSRSAYGCTDAGGTE